MLFDLILLLEDPTTRQAISAGYKVRRAKINYYRRSDDAVQVPVLQGLREHYKDSVLDASLVQCPFTIVDKVLTMICNRKALVSFQSHSQL